jgi:hypothetical protein
MRRRFPLLKESLPGKLEYLYRIVFPFAVPRVAEVACARKELAVLVERDGHDAISCEKGFFDAIAVMDVDIDIDYTLVRSGV